MYNGANRLDRAKEDAKASTAKGQFEDVVHPGSSVKQGIKK